MNKKLPSVFWGIVLIAAGIYAFAQSVGYEVTQDPKVWAFVFGGVGVISLVFYIAAGWKSWSWLIPVGVFGALAFLLAMVSRGVEEPWMAAPLFFGIGLPFVVGFFVDRKENWWAVIPAGVMAFLTLTLLLAERTPGEWIGSGLFFILAMTFFAVYLLRKVSWAAIVAYVMFVMGFMPLMGMTSLPELAGVIMFFAIGLPFLYTYVRSPERWWAVIPAGILLSLGIATAVVMLFGLPEVGYDDRVSNVIISLGTAVTFGVVWFRHQRRWAMFASLVALVIAVSSALFINAFDKVGPLVVIAVGGYILYNAILRQKAA